MYFLLLVSATYKCSAGVEYIVMCCSTSYDRVLILLYVLSHDVRRKLSKLKTVVTLILMEDLHLVVGEKILR